MNAPIQTRDECLVRGGCDGMNRSGTGVSVATDGALPEGAQGGGGLLLGAGRPSDGGGGGAPNPAPPKREPGGAAPGAVVGLSVAPQLPQYWSPWMMGASQCGHFAISVPRRASGHT